MEMDVAALLTDDDLLLLFTVIGLGYLVGNLRFGGIKAGPVIGVLLTALLFGHFGVSVPPGASSFGFALFIFSVGIQAGPTFFSAFAADGLRYIRLASVVAGTSLALALGLGHLTGLDYGFAAGLLAGALTSTPTLAGAQDAINSGIAELPQGVAAEQALKTIGVGYAITYVFGTVGMILAVRFFPLLTGIDLPAGAAQLARECNPTQDRGPRGGGSLPIVRAYRIPDSLAGKTLQQAQAMLGKARGKVLRIKRGGTLHEARPEFLLESGDTASFIADITLHAQTRKEAGEEVLDPELLDYHVTTREIVLVDAETVGKTLDELDLPNGYGCFATALTRAAIDLPLNASLPLQKGDRLSVVGEEDNLNRLAKAIGFVEQELETTDLATFAFGMIVGTLLGLVTVALGNLSVGLGSAGGLLIVGILIGYLGSVNPTFGRVPAPARYVLMELGLMVFMAVVGLGAGGGVLEALLSVGPFIVLGGITVTILPALAAYGVGRYLLHMDPALLLGAITGAMTSTPALNVVTEAARSGIPALGYAGTYTFANVLLTFAGTLVMVL